MYRPDHRLEKLFVGIIDNDAALLSALKFSLELEGFVVATYRSGAEILAEKQLPEAGCLIADAHLADMNGLDLITALRARSVKLPIIMILNENSHGLRRRAREAGVPVVEKPLFGNALVEAIMAANAVGF